MKPTIERGDLVLWKGRRWRAEYTTRHSVQMGTGSRAVVAPLNEVQLLRKAAPIQVRPVRHPATGRVVGWVVTHYGVPVRWSTRELAFGYAGGLLKVFR